MNQMIDYFVGCFVAKLHFQKSVSRSTFPPCAQPPKYPHQWACLQSQEWSLETLNDLRSMALVHQFVLTMALTAVVNQSSTHYYLGFLPPASP